MDSLVFKGSNEFKISDVVILLIAVNVVDKESNGHRPMMLSPDSPVFHLVVSPDVALLSD